MASSDLIQNAISSKIDEKSLNDLTTNLENSIPNSQSVISSVTTDGMPQNCLICVKFVKFRFNI